MFEIKSRLLSRWSTSPALPSFTSSSWGNPGFLKLLEAFKSHGHTVAALTLTQKNSVALRLPIASEAHTPNGAIPAEPTNTRLSSRALVTFSSEGCHFSYKPLYQRPFSHLLPSSSTSRCSRISFFWKDDLRCPLEQNCTSHLYV